MNKVTNALSELWRAHVEMVEDIADLGGDLLDEVRKLGLQGVLSIVYLWIWIACIVVFTWAVKR